MRELPQDIRWDLAGVAQSQAIRKRDPQSYDRFFNEEEVLERHTGFSKDVAQHLMSNVLSEDSEVIEYSAMLMRIFGHWPYPTQTNE